MFPTEIVFANLLDSLAAELAVYEAPKPDPLPCDRWIARSALQKCCRRGEIEIAQRALANLLVQDPRSIWRHLTIIALEDIGVAGIEVVANVVAASRDRAWRTRAGGDWRVASLLVQQMCQSEHCQAACDLWLRAADDPQFEQVKAEALAATPQSQLRQLTDCDLPLVDRGVVALALGGGLSTDHSHRDPGLVFDAMEGDGHCPRIVTLCRAAYRSSRDPMAMLLPLVWQKWTAIDRHSMADDVMPPVTVIHGVPGYALDQHTRIGVRVAVDLVWQDRDLGRILEHAGISAPQRPRTVGALLFLTEGGRLRRRLLWSEGDRLRLPYRMLPPVASLGDTATTLLQHFAGQQSVIAELRGQHFHSAVHYHR